MEKITEAVKLHLPCSLKNDVQDLAMLADKSVSQWIREVLSEKVYGIKGVNDSRIRRDDCYDRGE